MSVTDELEAMIDKHGLVHVLTGLELVCGEKAAHIKLNWHDTATAYCWSMCAHRMRRAAEYAQEHDL